jgi:hypothetical protein
MAVLLSGCVNPEGSPNNTGSGVLIGSAFGALTGAASREIQPLSVCLGALGMTGMAAWAGLSHAVITAASLLMRFG